MIDGWHLFTNSMWALGLAITLAVFSYADWRSSLQGKGLKATVKEVGHRPGVFVGFALACLGAGLSVSPWWERIAWSLIAAGSTCYAVKLRMGQRKERSR